MSNLRLGYGREPDIIAGVNLSLEAGQTVAILGPSGGGKSTLLKAAAGLLAPRKGGLEIVDATWPDLPVRGSVGYVPQRLGLVRHTSVLDNVLHGGLHLTGFGQSLLHRTPREVEERSLDALEQLGLAEKRDSVIHELSGGQQRRVAVARAIVQRPKLLLADEFLSELDPGTIDIVATAVKRLQAETGMGMLIVEHQLEQALRLADRVYRLKGGQLLELESMPGVSP
jgi:phosphonate transport system ATP-binding protein